MTTFRVKSDSFLLLESAAWPALIVDGGGTIRRANQAAIGLFGAKLKSDSILLSSLWAEEGESVDQFLARWERSPTPVLPLKLLGKGSAVTTFATWIAVLNLAGEKRFTFQLFPPEMAPGSTENPGPLVEANLAHKQKLDCALQLARTVALDFNNALTSILGHASLILSKMEPGHPWRSSLVEVEKAAEKAADVAHQLAAFSHAEKEVHSLPSTNVNALLHRLVEVFQRSNPSGISWSLELESRIYSTRFDEAKMQQALSKILENALEAMGETGRIFIASRNVDVPAQTHDGTVRLEPGSYIALEISDTGIGIEPAVLPRIFEPFFTTKPGHRGLGLAWVYGIVTNHGGGVTVASEPAQGASVRIYLPATKQIAAGEETDASDDLRGSETVLVVDDEDLILNMSQTILSSFGYTVLTANNGPRALELLSQAESAVDLVITDLIMPQMSGRELIEKILEISPGLPILCSSGYVRATGRERAAAFLQKPFTTQELLRRVKQVLTASEATWLNHNH